MDKSYLQPDFDPKSLKVAQIRNILNEHDIHYPSNAKKSDLLAIFDKEIAPERESLKAEYDSAVANANEDDFQDMTKKLEKKEKKDKKDKKDKTTKKEKSDVSKVKHSEKPEKQKKPKKVEKKQKSQEPSDIIDLSSEESSSHFSQENIFQTVPVRGKRQREDKIDYNKVKVPKKESTPKEDVGTLFDKEDDDEDFHIELMKSFTPRKKERSVKPESSLETGVKSPRIKSPTVKSPTVKSPTVKSPTVKSPTVKSPTVKSPTVKSPTVKSPTVKSPTVKSPTVKSPNVKSPNIKSPSIKSPNVKSLEVTPNKEAVNDSTSSEKSVKKETAPEKPTPKKPTPKKPTPKKSDSIVSAKETRNIKKSTPSKVAKPETSRLAKLTPQRPLVAAISTPKLESVENDSDSDSDSVEEIDLPASNKSGSSSKAELVAKLEKLKAPQVDPINASPAAKNTTKAETQKVPTSAKTTPKSAKTTPRSTRSTPRSVNSTPKLTTPTLKETPKSTPSKPLSIQEEAEDFDKHVKAKDTGHKTFKEADTNNHVKLTPGPKLTPRPRKIDYTTPEEIHLESEGYDTDLESDIEPETPETAPAPKARFGPIMIYILLWMVLSLFGLFTFWYREQTFLIGYCNHSIDEPTFFNPEYPTVNKLSDYLDAYKPNCLSCPAHARCFENLEIACYEDFVVYKPWYYDILPFINPKEKKCIPDTKKAEKLESMIDFSLDLLRSKNALINCGNGNDNFESGLTKTELYELLLSMKAPYITLEEFDELWERSLVELEKEPEIIVRQVTFL